MLFVWHDPIDITIEDPDVALARAFREAADE